EEDATRREAVRKAADRYDEGAGDEADLDGAREPADLGDAQAPRHLQLVGRAVRAEPERGGQQLRDDDDGQRTHGRRCSWPVPMSSASGAAPAYAGLPVGSEPPP